MGELKYEKSDREWAREKGIIRKCPDCNKDYDPHIGCTNPDCIRRRYEKDKLRQNKAKEQEEKKRKLKEAFDRIIWPDQ